jgi:hypothetical protein
MKREVLISQQETRGRTGLVNRAMKGHELEHLGAPLAPRFGSAEPVAYYVKSAAPNPILITESRSPTGREGVGEVGPAAIRRS